MLLCKSPFGSKDIVHTLDKFLIIVYTSNAEEPKGRLKKSKMDFASKNSSR